MKRIIAAIAFTIVLSASQADAGLIGRVANRARSFRPLQAVSQRIAERPRRVRKAAGRVARVRILPRNRG